MIKWLKTLFRSSKSMPTDYEDGLELVKYLIKKNDFTEAVGKLKMMLEKYLFHPELYLLLVDIYDNHLEKKTEAVKLVESYFAHHNIKAAPENIIMLLCYAEAASVLGHRGKAVHLLSHELTRSGYTPEGIKILNSALEHIKLELHNSPLENPDFIHPPAKDYNPSKICNQTMVFRPGEEDNLQ